jgi:hypothetical protein
MRGRLSSPDAHPSWRAARVDDYWKIQLPVGTRAFGASAFAPAPDSRAEIRTQICRSARARALAIGQSCSPTTEGLGHTGAHRLAVPRSLSRRCGERSVVAFCAFVMVEFLGWPSSSPRAPLNAAATGGGRIRRVA